MKNCVPQVFKWFVTHLFRGILASLIDETQGLFFLSKRVSRNTFFETLYKFRNLEKKDEKKKPKVANGDPLQTRQYKHQLMWRKQEPEWHL